MNTRAHLPGWARLSLLLAALLQFAGGAVGPWVHATADAQFGEAAALSAPAAGGGDASDAQGGSKRPAAPAHNERDCAVCQAFHAVSLPAGESVLPQLTAQSHAAYAAAETGYLPVSHAPVQARAPPAQA
ncbi:MAG TPA: DUF2946 family protein [Longimicrobiaceae bacterium]|jgi:hypothetical protein|nr:DUF2946 family protein [Longimicrobiaceae bacterium]